MSATIYQQADISTPSYSIGNVGGDTGHYATGHYATVHLDGHDLRMQTTDADDLDGLALVLMEAATALREARRIAGDR